MESPRLPPSALGRWTILRPWTTLSNLICYAFVDVHPVCLTHQLPSMAHIEENPHPLLNQQSYRNHLGDDRQCHTGRRPASPCERRQLCRQHCTPVQICSSAHATHPVYVTGCPEDRRFHGRSTRVARKTPPSFRSTTQQFYNHSHCLCSQFHTM